MLIKGIQPLASVTATPPFHLSEQQLVDCSKPNGTNGCYGGLYSYAWNYAMTYPLEWDNSYPYVGV